MASLTCPKRVAWMLDFQMCSQLLWRSFWLMLGQRTEHGPWTQTANNANLALVKIKWHNQLSTMKMFHFLGSPYKHGLTSVSPNLESQVYDHWRWCNKAHLTGWAVVADSDTDISSWNKVRAWGIDVWVPAQKLVHRYGVLITWDNVPASISVLHGIVKIAYSLGSASVLRWDIGLKLLTSRHDLHRIRIDWVWNGQRRES